MQQQQQVLGRGAAYFSRYLPLLAPDYEATHKVFQREAVNLI